jgi:hypothetical protein
LKFPKSRVDAYHTNLIDGASVWRQVGTLRPRGKWMRRHLGLGPCPIREADKIISESKAVDAGLT